MTVGTTLRLLAAIGLWAACFPLVTIGLGLTPHLSFTVMGAALAGLCLLALGILLGRPLSRGARTWGLVALVELGATTLVFLGMLRAAEFISLASQTSRALLRWMASGPRNDRLRIDAGNIDQLVGVENPEAPIVKLDNPILKEAAENSVDVDPGETRRVPNMFLRHGQTHLLNTMAWPLHAVPNKELKQ